MDRPMPGLGILVHMDQDFLRQPKTLWGKTFLQIHPKPPLAQLQLILGPVSGHQHLSFVFLSLFVVKKHCLSSALCDTCYWILGQYN